ncbi:hypothetical protein N665_1546s0012 [Sinapis alba]|nr:hypothetical protein N665_1546s0012 [Sinapis alba]
MSYFRLPKTICSNLASAMSDFWWSSSETLLVKQAWKIVAYLECLLSGVLKSRYFTATDFVEAKTRDRPSYAWRSILFGSDLLLKGLKRSVGNGNSMRVWTERWIDD